jgi:hypothetical protein
VAWFGSRRLCSATPVPPARAALARSSRTAVKSATELSSVPGTKEPGYDSAAGADVAAVSVVAAKWPPRRSPQRGLPLSLSDAAAGHRAGVDATRPSGWDVVDAPHAMRPEDLLVFSLSPPAHGSYRTRRTGRRPPKEACRANISLGRLVRPRNARSCADACEHQLAETEVLGSRPVRVTVA